MPDHVWLLTTCSVGIPCTDPGQTSDELQLSQAAHQQVKSLEDEHDYDYVDPNTLETSIPPETESLYYASKVIAPPTSRQEDKMELVVGSDAVVQPKKKPTVPPKPTKKQLSLRCGNSSKDQSSTADSTGGSADTSTGDSGFVDTRKYLKKQRGPPPKVPPKHDYASLNVAQREQAADYTATIPITERGKWLSVFIIQ